MKAIGSSPFRRALRDLPANPRPSQPQPSAPYGPLLVTSHPIIAARRRPGRTRLAQRWGGWYATLAPQPVPVGRGGVHVAGRTTTRCRHFPATVLYEFGPQFVITLTLWACSACAGRTRRSADDRPRRGRAWRPPRADVIPHLIPARDPRTVSTHPPRVRDATLSACLVATVRGWTTGGAGAWVAACQGACPPAMDRVRLVVLAVITGVAYGFSAYPRGARDAATSWPR